jgi:hypothetical protein
MTPEQALAAAWTHCAPDRAKDALFPRGFWPDVARVALAMYSQQTLSPELTFRPTTCTRGNYPEPAQFKGRKSGGKISAAEKAANTAKLLAMIGAPNA